MSGSPVPVTMAEVPARGRVRVEPLATAWLRLAGDGRLPMVAWVGLYRDLNAGPTTGPSSCNP